MLRTTRWSPDTCGCILEFEWDDAQDENTRVHSYKKVVKLCAEHDKLGFKDKPDYDQVMSENTRKNTVWGMVKTQLNLSDSDLEKYLWWFDGTRILQVSLLGINLTGAQRNKLQSDCNTQFGTNKVKVL